MPFPEHIERVFESFGIAADTKTALYELFVSMGEEVLQVFGDVAESVADPTLLRPEDCAGIRSLLVERYLVRNHPNWIDGVPTPSFYRPRLLEGRASGVAIPLGGVPARAIAMLDRQPVPDGVVVQGRNAHFGGRSQTVTFDVVAADVRDAIALGQAEGQQHTLPGSAGATSGTTDAANQIALLWEIQPNVFKPGGERNREIAKIYRRHRNWHLITLVAAIEWLRAKSFQVFILHGKALAATHEVNAARPVTPAIIALHDRTVERVTSALGLALTPPTSEDEALLAGSMVMNTGLEKHVRASGAAAAIWRVG